MTLLDYSYTALKKHARRAFIKRYLERERCKGQIIDATAMKPGDWWNGRRVSLCPKCGRPGFVEGKYENADHRLLIVNGWVSRSEDDCRWGRWEREILRGENPATLPQLSPEAEKASIQYTDADGNGCGGYCVIGGGRECAKIARCWRGGVG